MSHPALTSAVASAPRRTVTGRFWHQGPTRHRLTSFADPAVTIGRYHRVGGRGVWYASDQEQAAWSELFRHFLDDGVDPFELRRRVGHVDIEDLVVLDLCDERIQLSLGVTVDVLVGDDYSTTQEIADAAQAAGFGGVIAPSAALPGRKTLVVFESGTNSFHGGISRVRQPPPRIADLLRSIRLHRDVPEAVRGFLDALALAGAEAVRRRRRSRP